MAIAIRRADPQDGVTGVRLRNERELNGRQVIGRPASRRVWPDPGIQALLVDVDGASDEFARDSRNLLEMVRPTRAH